jgi:hypothetical protein
MQHFRGASDACVVVNGIYPPVPFQDMTKSFLDVSRYTDVTDEAAVFWTQRKGRLPYLYLIFRYDSHGGAFGRISLGAFETDPSGTSGKKNHLVL